MSDLHKSTTSATGSGDPARQIDVTGRVAGNVTYDFNDMLMVILGNLETLERRLGPGHELQHLIAAALGGATRAAQLLRRLLVAHGQPVAGCAAAPQPVAIASPPRRRGAAVLIVEDDPDVRSYTVDVTRELGYDVISAGDGRGALQLLEAHPEVRLLFTDVGLPGGMSGRQLADEAMRRQPSLKVLLTTGYAGDARVDGGRLDPGLDVVPKPFTYTDLASRIRRVFDGGRA